MTQDEVNKIKLQGMQTSLSDAFNAVSWEIKNRLDKLTIRSADVPTILAGLECKLTSLRQLHQEHVTLKS